MPLNISARKTILTYGVLFGLVGVTALILYWADTEADTLKLTILVMVVVAASIAVTLDMFGLLCVALAWLPFSFRYYPIEIGIVTFDPYILALIALTMILGTQIALGFRRYQVNRVDIVIVLICISFLFSTLAARNLMESGRLAYQGIFVPALSYFVARALLVENSGIRQAMWFFSTGIAVLAVVYIVEFSQTGRRVGVLNIPEISLASLLFCGFLATYVNLRRREFFGWLLVAIILVGLILSLSRAYIVALLLAPIFLMIIRRGRALLLLVVFLATSLAASLYLADNASRVRLTGGQGEGKHGFQRVIDPQYWETALLGRASSYKEGIELFYTSPLFGTGLTRDPTTYATRHNFHIAWLEYGGLVGYTLFTLLLLFHVQRASIPAKHDRLIAFNLILLLGILIDGLTNGIMHGMIPYLVLLFIGINEARITYLTRALKPTAK